MELTYADCIEMGLYPLNADHQEGRATIWETGRLAGYEYARTCEPGHDVEAALAGFADCTFLGDQDEAKAQWLSGFLFGVQNANEE